MLFFPHGLLPGIIGAVHALRRRIGGRETATKESPQP